MSEESGQVRFAPGQGHHGIATGGMAHGPDARALGVAGEAVLPGRGFEKGVEDPAHLARTL
jgi:hypothetical protein